MSRRLLRWLQLPGVIAWRWFTGKPLDGVPRSDAGWFTDGHKTLPRETASRPPDSLAGEVSGDVRGFLVELRELVVRRALRREMRDVERQVLAEEEDGGEPG